MNDEDQWWHRTNTNTEMPTINLDFAGNSHSGKSCQVDISIHSRNTLLKNSKTQVKSAPDSRSRDSGRAADTPIVQLLPHNSSHHLPGCWMVVF